MPDAKLTDTGSLPRFVTAWQFMPMLALIIACAAYVESAPVLVFRYLLLIAFACQVTLEIRKRDYRFLKSPAFLLGFASGFGFSLIPSFGHYIAEIRLIPNYNMDTFSVIINRPETLTYLGGSAEFMILAFSVACLAVYGLARAFSKVLPEPSSLPISGKTETVLIALSLLLSMLSLVNFHMHVLPNGITRILSMSYTPFQAIILMAMFHQYLTAGRKPIPLMLASALALLYLVLSHQLKAPVFLMVSAMSYFLFVRKYNFARLFKISLTLVVLLVVLSQVAQVLRYKEASILRHDKIDLTMATNALASKVVWRQIATGFCLDNVIEAGKTVDNHEADHLFWMRALIPRFLWPGKGNFSLGDAYALKYCNGTIQTRHSASVTLLGQPIIRTGMNGMLFHVGLLLAGLGILTWISIRSPGIGAIFTMALLPWWIDFDQDFALYIANLVKFFLLMCLIVGPVLWLGKAGTPSSGAA